MKTSKWLKPEMSSKRKRIKVDDDNPSSPSSEYVPVKPDKRQAKTSNPETYKGKKNKTKKQS